MDKHDLDVRLTVAEARLARMTKRLKYLRGSELYGYEDAGAYRQALHEYHAASACCWRCAAVRRPRAAAAA